MRFPIEMAPRGKTLMDKKTPVIIRELVYALTWITCTGIGNVP